MKKKLADKGVEYKGAVDAFPENGIEDGSAGVPSLSEKPIVGRLTNDRIRRLEALGFVWSLRDDWQRHYDELKQYKEEHGHCNV